MKFETAASTSRSDRRLSLAATLACAVVVAACAPMVPSAPARLEPAASASAADEIVMQRSVEIRLSTGYSRVLPATSRWQRIGRLPQGDVYRRRDGVFAIEGRQVHEACLVVAGNTLRGFYLPVESAFSPLSPEVQLPLGDAR